MRELLRARAACGPLLVCWVFSRFGSLRVRLLIRSIARVCMLCACASVCLCCYVRVLLWACAVFGPRLAARCCCWLLRVPCVRAVRPCVRDRRLVLVV